MNWHLNHAAWITPSCFLPVYAYWSRLQNAEHWPQGVKSSGFSRQSVIITCYSLNHLTSPTFIFQGPPPIEQMFLMRCLVLFWSSDWINQNSIMIMSFYKAPLSLICCCFIHLFMNWHWCNYKGRGQCFLFLPWLGFQILKGS